MTKCTNPLCTFTFTRLVKVYWLISLKNNLHRKTKPEFCPECRCHLKGTYVAKPPAKAKVLSTGLTVAVAAGMFSVRYHQHYRFKHINMLETIFRAFTRCMVVPAADGEVSMCSYKTCMEKRRLAVRNDQQFDCKHLQTVKDNLEADRIERLF